MTLAFPKRSSTMVAYPKTLCSIAASACTLAVFIVFVSLLLVSEPMGSSVRNYFYGVANSRNFDSMSSSNKIIHDSYNDGYNDSFSDASRDVMDKNRTSKFHDTNDMSNLRQRVETMSSPSPFIVSAMEPVDRKGQAATGNLTSSNVTQGVDITKTPSPAFLNSSNSIHPGLAATSLSPAPVDVSQSSLADSDCDLYHGKWVYDSTGPLYTNNSCPILTQMQNCQGNGRPDKDYENWRWKPSKCDLPRFDAKKFLELMREKTLAFIGDSVARNQMESLLCILWQVEVPKNRGNKKMQRYYFRSTSTMIVRIWSSWLVHQTSEPVDSISNGVVQLHLDAPDEVIMESIPSFDVVILSSGHWFAKQSIYILNNETVGGQLWWPNKARPMKVNNIEAFGISVETILSAMVTDPNYTGLTILRSFSPDHYEGGAWNTGGSCTGKVKPALDAELVENGFTNIMHKKQVEGFNRSIKKITNKSKLKLMDITEVFGYRHDGHPGPYRSPDPNKITKRGPDGKPPPQDCLHWCMPGPVDTWNELVLEIIRREFEGSHVSNF